MAKSDQFSTIHRQQRMLKALAACNGIVTRAAKEAGITPQSHYNWYKDSDDYAAQVDVIKHQCFEDFKDLVMEAVRKKIEQGNTAIISMCFRTMFAKWPEQMHSFSPYKERIKVRIIPVGPERPRAKDPFSQEYATEYDAMLQRQREGKPAWPDEKPEEEL